MEFENDPKSDAKQELLLLKVFKVQPILNVIQCNTDYLQEALFPPYAPACNMKRVARAREFN